MPGLPHFVHIGFPKTASTWLQDIFYTHPEVCFIYKPKFFHWDDCFSKGKDFYLSLFKVERVHKILLDSDEQYSIGFRYGSFGWDCCYQEKRSEAFGRAVQKFALSPDSKLIAQRIHQTLPDAKILIVVRNQADWIASFYKHYLRKRGESRPIRKFIEEEGLVSAGRYSSLLEQYFGLFGRENVLVLFYEELLNNPVNFLDRISNFMGISKFDYSQISRKTKLSLTNRGAKIIRKLNYLQCPLLTRLFLYLDRKLFRRLKDSEFISQKDKEYLMTLFAEDNKKLSRLLNQPNLYE